MSPAFVYLISSGTVALAGRGVGETEVFGRMWVRSVMALGAQDTNSSDSQSCCAIPLLHEAQKDSKQPFVTPSEPWPPCSLCSINPVTGRVEEKLPNPMEGMTEEQKEHEAMKLVNMFDKLSRYWAMVKRSRGERDVGKLFPQHGLMMCKGGTAIFGMVGH